MYVSKALKLRGQAWVVFDKASDASEAMDAIDGFPLFDKPMAREPRRTAPRAHP